MTNKPTYMKRIIAGSSLLFSILLATPQAYAQESVDVISRENGTERREVIDLPKSKAIVKVARKLVNRLFFVLKHQTEYVNSCLLYTSVYLTGGVLQM